MSTKDVLGIGDHFEKMLYDSALLSRVYLHAFQASGDPFFRRIVEETLDYVLREMTGVGGPTGPMSAPTTCQAALSVSALMLPPEDLPRRTMPVPPPLRIAVEVSY